MDDQTDIVEDDPDIPETYPSSEDAAPEVDDQPMGPSPDADPDEQPQPGLMPEGQEPPDAG